MNIILHMEVEFTAHALKHMAYHSTLPRKEASKTNKKKEGKEKLG